MKLTVVPV